jgi:hypothetical protein
MWLYQFPLVSYTPSYVSHLYECNFKLFTGSADPPPALTVVFYKCRERNGGQFYLGYL